MKEQVQDIEFFPKDPTKIELADLAGRKRYQQQESQLVCSVILKI